VSRTTACRDSLGIIDKLFEGVSRHRRMDIKLAKGNPDAVFTAIHPNFYPDAAPYLLTGVDLPPTNPKFERGSGVEEEQALAKKSPDQASTVEKFVSSGRTGAKEQPSTAGTTDIIGEFNRIWDDPRPGTPADKS
jgi:hypothetical protein